MSDDQNDQGSNADPAGIRKALDKANAEKAALAEEHAKLAREVAFLKAGIQPEGAAKWFMRAYDGELTPEAIKAAALADGIISDAPPSDPPDAEAHTRIDQATATSQPPADPEISAQMRKAYETGGSEGLKAFLAERGALA